MPCTGDSWEHGERGDWGALSVRSREELSSFISASVLPQTNQVYSKEFTLWREFVRVETGIDDPFLLKGKGKGKRNGKGKGKGKGKRNGKGKGKGKRNGKRNGKGKRKRKKSPA
jgi:hypothetical protein